MSGWKSGGSISRICVYWTERAFCWAKVNWTLHAADKNVSQGWLILMHLYPSLQISTAELPKGFPLHIPHIKLCHPNVSCYGYIVSPSRSFIPPAHFINFNACFALDFPSMWVALQNLKTVWKWGWRGGSAAKRWFYSSRGPSSVPSTHARWYATACVHVCMCVVGAHLCESACACMHTWAWRLEVNVRYPCYSLFISFFGDGVTHSGGSPICLDWLARKLPSYCFCLLSTGTTGVHVSSFDMGAGHGTQVLMLAHDWASFSAFC